MGNEAINEIYVIAVMAKAAGQDSIPVHLFPFRMSNTNLSLFKMAIGSNTKLASFWDSLFPAYLYFEENKKVPAVEIDSEGNYLLLQNQP
jgi:murein L,D-transpeptidase YafK